MAEQQKPQTAATATTGKKGKKPSLTPEQRQQERRARFLNQAPRRVNNALKRISQVANLANRASYSFTEEEAKRVYNTILDAATEVRDRFSGGSKDKPLFSL